MNRNRYVGYNQINYFKGENDGLLTLQFFITRNGIQAELCLFKQKKIKSLINIKIQCKKKQANQKNYQAFYCTLSWVRIKNNAYKRSDMYLLYSIKRLVHMILYINFHVAYVHYLVAFNILAYYILFSIANIQDTISLSFQSNAKTRITIQS